MRLKDLIKRDNAQVFFNPDEFGELHNINGKDYLIVVDSDRMEQRSATSLKELDEFTQKGLLFFIRKSDCEGLRLETGASLVFDNRHMTILDVKEDHDVIEVTVSQNVG